VLLCLCSRGRKTRRHPLQTYQYRVNLLFFFFFLLACLSLAFAGDMHGFAFTSQHNLTADEFQNHCWVDSACTKSVFRSKDLLINVTQLSVPQNVSSIGSSVITVHYQGDYPLVLSGPSGKVHLKLIKNVCFLLLLAPTSLAPTVSALLVLALTSLPDLSSMVLHVHMLLCTSRTRMTTLARNSSFPTSTACGQYLTLEALAWPRYHRQLFGPSSTGMVIQPVHINFALLQSLSFGTFV
jgi:hypothetical protein